MFLSYPRSNLPKNLSGVRDSSGKSDEVMLFQVEEAAVGQESDMILASQYPLRPKWRPLSEGWNLEKVSAHLRGELANDGWPRQNAE
eukprot:760679-Hanusia_phi.AAC.2